MKRIQISEPPKVTLGRDTDCFEVSDETCTKIKELIKADKPKPKFKPVLCHCLEVSVRGQYVVVRTIRDDFDNDTGCTQEPEDARRMARTLLDAAASVEANK